MDPLNISSSPPPFQPALHRSSSSYIHSPPQHAGGSNTTTPTSSSATFREPKVFGDPGMALADPAFSPVSETSGGKGKEREAQRGYLRVRITGLERNRKDLLIRFDASTNLPNFRTGIYRNMQRSYIEFTKFAEQAQLTSPQTIIPALPLASTSATTDEEDDRLVRIALQRWFTRICEDPALLKDEELRNFIESDFGYSPTPPPTARRTTSAASAVPFALTAALSKVVRRGPLDEDDELASAKGALEKLETTWGGAAAAINSLRKARRAHALANQDVGAKLISLSTVESDYNLAAAERKTGRALETLAGVAGAQTASENIILSDSLGYQALNARSAKDALVQRTQLLEDAQTASKSAITKRRNVERLKGSSSINPSKVDDAISEMDDADALEKQLARQLEAISSNLHISLRQHSRNTHEDIALALLENARLTVGFHKHILRELEAVRPDLAKVGSEKGADVLTAATNAGLGTGTTYTPAPTKTGMSTSASQPHMTGSRPYDSPPTRNRPLAPDMATSKSMFLPPPPSSMQQQAAPPRSSSTNPQQQNVQTQASADPLGGQMAQSMVLPPGHRPGAGGRQQGRRLDERQAAKLLAGGF